MPNDRIASNHTGEHATFWDVADLMQKDSLNWRRRMQAGKYSKYCPVVKL
jgi:hypothetical protein